MQLYVLTAVLQKLLHPLLRPLKRLILRSVSNRHLRGSHYSAAPWNFEAWAPSFWPSELNISTAISWGPKIWGHQRPPLRSITRKSQPRHLQHMWRRLEKTLRSRWPLTRHLHLRPRKCRGHSRSGVECFLKKKKKMENMEIRGISQCGHFRIFLSLRFYVKPILENVEVQNLSVLQF